MTDAVDIAEAEPAAKPKGKRGLMIGLVLALALGGGSFYAIWSGLFDPTALFAGGGSEHGASHDSGHDSGHGSDAAAPAVVGDIAFVAMDPIMISLPPGSSSRLLRFAGQLEVAPESAATVAALMPRVLDVLNTYLRAVEVRDLEDPAALARLRAQMLRRVQVVIGEGQVHDLLVTEFVLN
jgi:flagellar FliL protein